MATSVNADGLFRCHSGVALLFVLSVTSIAGLPERTRQTYQEPLELPYVVITEDKLSAVAESRPPLERVRVQVSVQAPRIIAVDRLVGPRRPIERERPEPDHRVIERTPLDASAASAGREHNPNGFGIGPANDVQNEVWPSGNKHSIAANGSIGAIEKGAASHVVHVQAPLPVG